MTSSSSEIEIISSDSSSSPKQIPPEVITDVFGACAYGDLAKLRILVEKEGALLTQQDGNGYYPLQWAALNNFADAIHYQGGDVDAVRGSVAAADVLLQNGARVEAVDVNGHRAIADLTKSLEFEPDSADILHERGIVNFKIKDFKAATEDLSECVKLDKDNKSAYTYLGLALSSLGEYKKAEEARLKAIQIDQNFLDAWGHLAQFYQDLASSEKALDCLEKALKIDDRFAKGYHLRGLLLHAMGDHRKAIKDLSVGLSIESSNIECLYLRASCHHAVGEYKEAVKDYDAALDLELDSMDKFVLQCLAFYQGDVYPVEYNYNCIMDQVLDAHWGCSMLKMAKYGIDEMCRDKWNWARQKPWGYQKPPTK